MISLMNRRNFLYSSAAAAAPFIAAEGTATAAAMGPGEIRLGVATYSFRSFQRDLCIKYVKQLGIEYVDIKEFHLSQTDPVSALQAGRKAFDKAGLKVIGGGNVSLPEADEAGMRKHFEYAKAVGFPMIICAPTNDNLGVVEKLAKEFDIKIAIHNHGPEDKHFPSPKSVLDAIKGMDKRMGLCMDIGHTVRTGADPVQSIVDAGPRLFELHMKDLANLKERDSQVPVGDGKIPIPEIFKQLIKVGYQGVCSLEYEINADDPVPGMQKSFAYMRGVVAGLKSA
jgi:sugar phosphate isomerase/epimerase